MGKFAPSVLHDVFSEWHWKNCNHKAWLCDVDRIFVEIRDGKPTAVFEIKSLMDVLTYTEHLLCDWFEQHDVPYYMVQMQRKAGQLYFYVWRLKTQQIAVLHERQMAYWINHDCNTGYFEHKAEPVPEYLVKLHDLVKNAKENVLCAAEDSVYP